MTNVPCTLVTALWVVPVAVFLTTAVAPGIAPPEASTTVPVSDVVTPPWA
jgi:hypothetical protein